MRTRSVQRLARTFDTNRQTDRQTDRHRSTLYYRYYFFCFALSHSLKHPVLLCLSVRRSWNKYFYKGFELSFFFYFLLTTQRFNDNLLCLCVLCYLCTQSCLFLFIDSIERIKMYKYLRYKTRLNVIIMIIDHVTWKQFLSRGVIGHSNFHSVVGWSVQIMHICEKGDNGMFITLVPKVL